MVDPGDGAVVLAWLAQNPQVQLDTILVTHHHADHTAGLAELTERTGATVHAPAMEKMPVAVHGVQQGDDIFWHGLRLQVLDVPGHTAGHIAFWSAMPDQSPVLFCGDTLFSGGCGRVFEGTPAQMLDSLDRLAALPSDTRVCPAHEYTLSNIRFALAVEPNNLNLISWAEQAKSLREQGLPTLPTTIGQELQVNPFMRCDQPEVIAMAKKVSGQAALPSPAHVLAVIRAWKDRF